MEIETKSYTPLQLYALCFLNVAKLVLLFAYIKSSRIQVCIGTAPVSFQGIIKDPLLIRFWNEPTQ